MKALTIWQPWASLILYGWKPYEFRGWPAPGRFVGERIAIHAGARPVKPAEISDLILRLRGEQPWTTGLRPEALAFLDQVKLTPGMLPLSHVLCTVTLGRPVIASRISAELARDLGGVVNDSDRQQHSNWAWPVSNIEPLMPPVPAKGAQGLWDWREAA